MSKSTVAIIGGADGPTSVFLAGRKKKIIAGERTLEDVVAYAAEKYDATKADITRRKYATQKLCLKESLISRYKPELLGDFHIYEIGVGDGRLEMEVDYHWNIFAISYSGSKKNMKLMKSIAKDLYLYYGVSEEDIQQKSERYHSLLAILSM